MLHFRSGNCSIGLLISRSCDNTSMNNSLNCLQLLICKLYMDKERRGCSSKAFTKQQRPVCHCDILFWVKNEMIKYGKVE